MRLRSTRIGRVARVYVRRVFVWGDIIFGLVLDLRLLSLVAANFVEWRTFLPVVRRKKAVEGR